MTNYKNLQTNTVYTREQIEEYSQLKKEIESLFFKKRIIQKKIDKLLLLEKEYSGIDALIWKTKEGNYVPISDMADEELNQVAALYSNRNSELPEGIFEEIFRRFGEDSEITKLTLTI